MIDFSRIKDRFNPTAPRSAYDIQYARFDESLARLLSKLRVVGEGVKGSAFPIDLSDDEASIWKEMILNTKFYADFCRVITKEEGVIIHRTVADSGIIIAVKKDVSGVFAEPKPGFWQRLTGQKTNIIFTRYRHKNEAILRDFSKNNSSILVSALDIEKETVRMLKLFSSRPGLAIRAPLPDAFWHEMIVDTEFYMQFCHFELQMEKGDILNHIPGNDALQIEHVVGYNVFLDLYCASYNELPPSLIWPYSIVEDAFPLDGVNARHAAQGLIKSHIAGIIRQSVARPFLPATTSERPERPLKTPESAAIDCILYSYRDAKHQAKPLPPESDGKENEHQEGTSRSERSSAATSDRKAKTKTSSDISSDDGGAAMLAVTAATSISTVDIASATTSTCGASCGASCGGGCGC
ncbi:glycine-rich domain-containing protein [Acetobacter persici]|nr:hypothetical protein [Acetobacter persici]